MTPDQYEEEQLLIQYLSIEETLFKAIQKLQNLEECVDYQKSNMNRFPFLKRYHVENKQLDELLQQMDKARSDLETIEKNIMQDLDNGGFDFIKDEPDAFHYLNGLYLQNRGDQC